MDPRFQRRVQRYGWDKAAGLYERYWAQQIEPAQSRLLELAAIAPGERVLDVACGTGLVTLRAAALAGVAGEVIGTDISDQMVATAAGHVAGAEGIAKVQFERMDAESLTFTDSSFDIALCSLGLMYAPDPRRAVEEMFRVLRHGGRAAAAVWGARERCGWAEILPIVDARVQSEVCPLFFQLGTGDQLADTFEAAGFDPVETERISTFLHYATADDACGAAFAGGPVALAYSRFDAAVRESAHAEYLASIEQYRTATGYNVPGEFVIVLGEKPEEAA
jgi:ubiquinone/menaquinone biosynthesis C-methylase UbiE